MIVITMSVAPRAFASLGLGLLAIGSRQQPELRRRFGGPDLRESDDKCVVQQFSTPDENVRAPVDFDSFSGNSERRNPSDPQHKAPQDVSRFERIAATATHPIANPTRTRTMMSPIGMPPP